MLYNTSTVGLHWNATERPAPWLKVPLLERALLRDGCKLAVWIDADALFLWPLELSTVPQRPVVVVRDDQGVNTGVIMVLHPDIAHSQWPTEFLRKVWKRTEFNGRETHGAYEQAAVRAVLREDSRRTDVQVVTKLVMQNWHGGGVLTRLRDSLVNGARTAESPAIFHPTSCFQHPVGHCRLYMSRLYGPAADTLRSRSCERWHVEPFNVANGLDVRRYPWETPGSNETWSTFWRALHVNKSAADRTAGGPRLDDTSWH